MRGLKLVQVVLQWKARKHLTVHYLALTVDDPVAGIDQDDLFTERLQGVWSTVLTYRTRLHITGVELIPSAPGRRVSTLTPKYLIYYA